MNKLKTLALSMGTIGLSSLAIPAYAASNTEVDALRKEVNELKQLVQQLSTQQKAAPVVMAPPPAPAPMVAAAPAPKAPSNAKPGWFTLPDGQTQVKLYGSIRGDATYDFEGNPSPNINNNTNSVPLNSANATKNNLNVSAATTRFGFDFSRPTDLGELTGKIEADFAGGIAADSSSRTTNGNGSLRVRHAYFSLGKWLVGQTTSPFVNTDTAPETVDFNGPMGYGSTRTVQVRYTQPIDANQKVLLAVEGGDVDNFNSATTVSGVNTNTSGGNRLPALTARYDYTTADKKGLVQVHGLVHENRVSFATAANDTGTNVDETKLGWGIGIGGKYSLTPADTLFANYYHVKGDNRYLLYGNSAYVATLNGTATTNSTDVSIYESEFNSGLIGYSHKWSPKLRSTLAAGAIWYKDNDNFAVKAPNLNKQLYNVIVNSFYTPTKNVDLGVEYTYGQREIFADKTAITDNKGDYSRLNLMAKYSF
ncbi:DcaP family trimeric outer membrane transporter [Acinetobacter soli]|uniref:DcaP family trimeric outer membrane transporter n=1 Tax=Acinetobacter soli TaxID=487316 RepID=UPI001BC88409|nr:DcaP family trimeric outer membrane transporter [Acinetobacter soli]